MKLYRLKVSIMGLEGVSRTIEASGNCTFDELHWAIFKCFDRYDPHLYSFFLTGRDTDSLRTIHKAQEITHTDAVDGFMGMGGGKDSAAEKTLDSAGLHEGMVLHYWFDFGDDWWHRIHVESAEEAGGGAKRLKVVESVGESPPQYPDTEGEW